MSFYLLLIVPILYAAASIYYVYRFRGTTRFKSYRSYARKAWPLFAPLNLVLFTGSPKKAAQAWLEPGDYPELLVLSENYEAIRKEGSFLLESGLMAEACAPGADGSHDIGFQTFFKQGWNKFYVSWYGTDLDSARRYCPETASLIDKIPSVRGALFTVLPPGSKLSLHCDPFAVSLRYHLGLETPNSRDCHIIVDDQLEYWRDGQAFLFDETYPHLAENNTATPRLILMCDIERPITWWAKPVAVFYGWLVKHTVVPNLPGDHQGFVSRAMMRMGPFRAWARQYKHNHKFSYTVVKHCLNYTLIALPLIVFAWVGSLWLT